MMRTEPVTADSVPMTADKAGDEGMRTWLNES